MRKLFATARAFFSVIQKKCAVEIATNEIAQHNGKIAREHLQPMFGEERERHTEIIECVSNAVREAAHDEKRHTKEEWQVLALSGKGDGRRHDKAATDGEDAVAPPAGSKSAFQNALRRFLQGHRRAANHQGNQEAANDVAKEYEQQLEHLTLLNKPGRAGVELEGVVHNSKKAESKEHGPHNGLGSEIAETGDAYADASQNGRTEEFKQS